MASHGVFGLRSVSPPGSVFVEGVRLLGSAELARFVERRGGNGVFCMFAVREKNLKNGLRRAFSSSFGVQNFSTGYPCSLQNPPRGDQLQFSPPPQGTANQPDTEGEG